ncbi:MAG: alpha amylase N-terminal ig-like domain-containing protein [Spirochaetia bacterium]
MEFRRTIHSEVNNDFVSKPNPGLGETVTISVRHKKDDAVVKMYLRTLINASDTLVPMKLDKIEDDMVYYSCELEIRQPVTHYHFAVETGKRFFFYTRQGVTAYHPTEDFDFVIQADFADPKWVPGTVFYHIFPDRFKNGNPENDVKTGEYTFDGHKPKKMNWDDDVLEYDEGFCMDFFGGDLEGIIQKIPYLKELGVNAVYLNPIFDAKTTHHYDCVDYFHVDPHFGGDQGLAKLSDELHKNGMKLMLDISINHTGIDHPWLKNAQQDRSSDEHGFYYFDDAGNPIGWMDVHTLPQLNYSSEKLKDIMYRNDDSVLRHWLKPPYSIDAWRFDVGSQTGRRNSHQFSNDLWKEIRKQIKEINPEAYMIGEHWEDNISYLLGDQWDGAMNYFASGRPLRTFAGEADRFLYKLADLSGKLEAYSGDELAAQILQHYNRLPNQTAFLQFNLIDSHDTHRFHNNTDVFDWDVYRGLIILLFLLPGATSIYYGDEIALDGHIQTHEGCRYPMEWDQSKWNKDFLALYKTLTKLKTSEESFATGSYRVLYTDNMGLAFARFTLKDGFIALVNRAEEARTIAVPVDLVNLDHRQTAKDVFTGKEYTVGDQGLEIALAPKENLLLKFEV